MTAFDMAMEWIQHTLYDKGLYVIETEYDGMECDGSSEPFEYDNGCSSAQPDFIVQGQ